MPTYTYDCDSCGSFELNRPMSAVSADAGCPECTSPARRVFGAPGLNALDPNLRRRHDAAAASASEPAVVRSVPGRSRRATPITTDPRHARLPRP
ncbi:zinc ribbon domain-containing protein [Mycobacterium yunnanensis]|uniref:Zinc ribbon domain-containing protein n=1 Tax=Mycobacterium yunnanensis TaxID=368477 RepID=A0A9X2Z5E5_9MYCO|nr:FmdB family zinc ribbon protein [Mycobacterium yunnanensis]MCV7422102.1 zinc ribbon domain-containing protein [Mycobacterium yunnanensis]